MPSPRSINTPVLIGKETVTSINYTSKNGEILLDKPTSCLEVHITPFPEDMRREYINKQRIVESLGQIAHYLDLRAPFYKPEYVVGLTHLKVGRIAAKIFNFDLITNLPASSYPDGMVEALEIQYQGIPCAVVMSVDRLLEVYQAGEAFESTHLAARRANLVDSLVIKADVAIAEYEKSGFKY